MWLYKIGVLFYLIDITLSFKQRECKSNTLRFEEQKVKNSIFSNYDSTNPPCSNKTTIDFSFFPSTITFNEMDSTLEIHCETQAQWIDQRLMWDEKKFNLNNTEIPISEDDIWTPDIVMHSSADLSKEQVPSSTYCILFSSGEIFCKSSAVYTVMCHTDYTSWPFDIQYCDVQLGSWAHENTVLNLTSRFIEWMWETYIQNPQWEMVHNKTGVTDTKNKYESGKNSTILWTQIALKRRSNLMQTYYITPGIVLMVLTLTTLWLESKSTERLILVCINFICHLLCIQNIQWRLPANGQAAPLILLFYEKSLILAAFALLLTVVLAKLQKSNAEAPKLLMFVTSYVLMSKIGKLLFISILDPKVYVGLNEFEDVSVLISATKKGQSWKYVSIFFGWISLIAVLITYTVILTIYLPRDSSEVNTNFFEMRLKKFSDSDAIISV